MSWLTAASDWLGPNLPLERQHFGFRFYTSGKKSLFFSVCLYLCFCLTHQIQTDSCQYGALRVRTMLHEQKNVVSRLILLEKEWSKVKKPSVCHGCLIIRFEDTGRHRREDIREYLHDFSHVLTSHVRSLLQPPPASPRPATPKNRPLFFFFRAADRWFWSKKCECGGIQGAVKVKTVSAQITVIGTEGKERGGWGEARGEIELYRWLERSCFHARARCTLGAFSDSWRFYGFYPSSSSFSFSSYFIFSLPQTSHNHAMMSFTASFTGAIHP